MTGIRHPEESTVAAREPLRRYDLVKEFVIAFVVVSLLTVALSALFSSPDVKPITLAQWAKADPNDFVATAVTELAGTSGTAGYGPPYNNTSGASQQQKWASDYSDALAKAPDGNPSSVKPGDYGPVPALAGRLLDLARSSALDGALMSQGGFYQTDYTRSVLLLADSSYLEDRASAQHLAGEQWGMMNETGNFSGQAWLWLYTFWYQIKPFSTSDNADAWVWWLMALLSLVLVLVPFIPGLRSLPRYLGIYRLIWRDHYRAQRTAARE